MILQSLGQHTTPSSGINQKDLIVRSGLFANHYHELEVRPLGQGRQHPLRPWEGGEKDTLVGMCLPPCLPPQHKDKVKLDWSAVITLCRWFLLKLAIHYSREKWLAATRQTGTTGRWWENGADTLQRTACTTPD